MLFAIGNPLRLSRINSSTTAVARGMLQPRPQDGDNPLLHSTSLLLFDDQGRCRGRYLSTEDSEMAKLKTDNKLFVNRDIFRDWSAAREVEFEEKLLKLRASNPIYK